MDKLKYVRLENPDGSYSSPIPLSTDGNYIDINGKTLTEELNNKATKEEVQAVASGSPAGVYTTVSALTTADPDHKKIYLVTADGHWYYYNSGWQDGGDYQAVKIQDRSVTYEKLDSEITDILDSVENITVPKQIISLSSVKAMPNELLQGGGHGKCVRTKNPKVPIYGVKIMTNVDPTTLYVGVGNGDNVLNGTIYLTKTQSIFNKIASIEIIGGDSNKLIEKNIMFDEPIYINSDNLFIGFWGWKGSQYHQLNCNLRISS